MAKFRRNIDKEHNKEFKWGDDLSNPLHKPEDAAIAARNKASKQYYASQKERNSMIKRLDELSDSKNKIKLNKTKVTPKSIKKQKQIRVENEDKLLAKLDAEKKLNEANDLRAKNIQEKWDKRSIERQTEYYEKKLDREHIKETQKVELRNKVEEDSKRKIQFEKEERRLKRRSQTIHKRLRDEATTKAQVEQNRKLVEIKKIENDLLAKPVTQEVSLINTNIKHPGSVSEVEEIFETTNIEKNTSHQSSKINEVTQQTETLSRQKEKVVQTKQKLFPVPTLEVDPEKPQKTPNGIATDNNKIQKKDRKKAKVVEANINVKEIKSTVDTKQPAIRQRKQDINEATSKLSNPNRQDAGHKNVKIKKERKPPKPSPKKGTKQPPAPIAKVPRRKLTKPVENVANVLENLTFAVTEKKTVLDLNSIDQLKSTIKLTDIRVDQNNQQIYLLNQQLKNRNSKHIKKRYGGEVEALEAENVKLHKVKQDIDDLIVKATDSKAKSTVNAEVANQELRDLIDHSSSKVRKLMNDAPETVFRAKVTKFVTDKQPDLYFKPIDQIRMHNLSREQVARLARTDFRKTASKLVIGKNPKISYRETRAILRRIRSKKPIIMDNDIQQEITELLKINDPDKLTPRQLLKKRLSVEGEAFDKLSTKAQLSVLQAKMRYGGVPTGIFENVISNVGFEGDGFWKQLHYLASGKAKSKHRDFVMKEARSFIGSYLTETESLWMKPKNIRQSVRPYYEQLISSQTFEKEIDAEMFRKEVKLARAKAKGYDLNDNEVDILRRTLNKQMNTNMSTRALNKAIGRIGHLRELKGSLDTIGDYKTSAEVSELLTQLNGVTDEKVFKTIMKKADKLTSNLKSASRAQLVQHFAEAQSSKSVMLSTRKAFAGVATRVGIVGGVISATVNLAGYALTGAMKLATKASSYISAAQNRDFGSGKALTTQSLATTNQRATKIMMNNKYGARRWLGMEAKLYGK